MLTNFSPTESNIKKAAQEALKDAEPLAQNGYKIQLAKNLVTKLLTDLTA
jgi:CO/xanthine dehydrogenase FAD-binding subunit